MTLMPPNSSCPPFFAPSTPSARRIAPAQVPQTGLILTNALRGSRSPTKRARSAMVVDSPPGITRASHLARSSGVLTKQEVIDVCGIWRRERIAWCSAKAPCNAEIMLNLEISVQDFKEALTQYPNSHCLTSHVDRASVLLVVEFL